MGGVNDYCDLSAAHQSSFKNKESVLRSTQCGCFACKTVFPASEVYFRKEEDGLETAYCPYCGMDAVIGDASCYSITPEFLAKMNKRWF